jgi:acyl-coenzyme A synthetase/AMP-(fatty) acid ligase
VESAILGHEAVANCGVVGIEVDGEACVVAGVQLVAGVIDSEEVRSAILAAAGSLGEHERPSRVVVLEELPTVLGGAKVQRGELRSRIEAAWAE